MLINSDFISSKVVSLNYTGNGPKNVMIALDRMQSPYKYWTLY